MGQNFQVVKASGVMEPFDEEKLRKSLRRSGAEDALINQIIRELSDQWHDGITTKSIFKRAFKMLKRRNRPYAARYTLKQAMFDFGPSGFPFEDFVAEVLKSQGYEVETRKILPGACIRHEMDVVAQKENLVLSVGASEYIDNSKDKFTEKIGNRVLDVIIDTTGNIKIIQESLKFLSNSGRYILVGQPKPSEDMIISNA
jgi:hypothetical protein